MKSIEIISIPVANQETAKSFYVNQLGFTIIFESNTPQGKWLQLSLPNDSTSISLVTGKMAAKPGSVKGTIISTGNIEKDIETLRNKGIQLPDVQNFPHGKITLFNDPDGNQWILRQAAKY